MATVLIKERVNVTWPERTEGSSFALPGQNATPVYLATDYWVEAVVLDDFETYFALTSGNVTANHVLVSNSYTMGAWASATNWAWSYSGSVVVPSHCVQVAGPQTIGVTANTGTNGDATHGYFDWGFPIIDTSSVVEGGTIDASTLLSLGFKDMGQLSGFVGEGTTGYVYISGIGTYAVTQPIYPTPAQIEIPRLLKPIVEADYYPWARLISGAWTSYDTDGHSLTRLPSDDLKNKESGDGSTVYYMKDSAWAVMPKLG